MKIRGLAYVALLVICIVIQLLTWLPISSRPFIEFLVCGQWLSEVVFFGILAGVLRESKERIWIVVIAWITFLTCLAKLIPLQMGHWYFDTEPLTFLKLFIIFRIILYISLLFARQGPLQILLRWLAVIPVIPVLVPHLTYTRHHVSPLAIAVTGACITLLQYILLIDIVWNTPELQSAEGIDFP